MTHTRTVAAPVDAVRAAALAPVETGFADPVDPRVEDGDVSWSSRPDLVEDVRWRARIRAQGEGTVLSVEAAYTLRLPYFAWLFAPLVRHSVRRALAHIAEVIAARAAGAPLPPPVRRPFWAPPDRPSEEQARAIATICAALVVAGFTGSLFTQTLDFVADSYDASDAQLGVALAVTRVGTLIGFVGSIAADRHGRRRILLAALAGLALVTLASALAPSLPVLAAMQVLARGFVNVATLVGYIMVIEESSEGGRAYSLALAGMASGGGFAIGAVLLPVADLAPDAWRLLFAAGGLALALVPGMASRLRESRRFAAIGELRGAARRLADATYGRRFALVAATGFLTSLFAAPAFQFTNRYLGDERGYSALGILLLRVLTQGAPALVAIWVGGRLAESHGRIPVARIATLAVAFGSAAFFLGSGAILATAMLISTVAAAVSGPAMTSFSTELFPTEGRGRAGAGLLVVSVAGSVVGLLLVGYLSDPIGSVGRAIAVTCIAPAIVAVLLIPRLPEARGFRLDDISPP